MQTKQPDLRVSMPAPLKAALERAAKRHLCNVATFARQALRDRLAAEGLLPADDETTRTAERVSA